MQLPRRRPYIHEKRDQAQQYTDYIGNIVSVSFDTADAASLYAAVFFGFEDAGEGGGDGCAAGFQVFRGEGGRVAGCNGEEVDEFEDEEAGKGAAEIGDAEGRFSLAIQKRYEK